MRLAPMKAIQQLQLEVLTKFNVTQLQPSDCKDLSVLVRDCTGKIVSETTIKRFFGFAAQTFNFSVYTLNALAEYAGFQNWEFFLEHYRLQQSPQKEFHPKWKEVKSKTGKISFYTTETIKNNCGMDFTRTATRTEALPFQQLLASDTSVSVILGASGSGKSVTLAQAVESFWLHESCLFPNDICLFVHLHHLNTLINRGFSMEDWLDNQLNLGEGENILDYFEEHNSEKDGRFILIVDGLDDKVISSDKLRVIYSKLMDLVFSRAHTPWLKIFLAARPETWNALYTPLGFYGDGMETSHAIQVVPLPPLSPAEVRTVLKNHDLPEDTASTLTEPFVQLLEFPPFLQLAVSLMDTGMLPLIHETALTYKVIGHYVRGKVMNSPDYGLKMAIVRRILDDTHHLRTKVPAGQVKLFSGDIRVQEAYRKLLADHILEEDAQDGQRSVPVKKVRFCHPYIAQFFIATFCLSTYNGDLSQELFQELTTDFEDSADQMGVLQWILLYAVDQGAYDAIPRLLDQIPDLSRKALLVEFLLVQQPGTERHLRFLRALMEDKPLKTYFLRNFLLYTVQGTRRNCLHAPLLAALTEEEDKVNLACLYYLSGLQELDAGILNTQIAHLQSLTQPLHPEGSTLHPAELCVFIQQCLLEKKPDPVVRAKIDQFEEYMVLTDHNVLSLREELTVYLLLCSAVLLKEYKHLERISEYVFTEIPSLKMRSHDPFRLLSLLVKSAFYIYAGDYAQHNKCIRHVESVLESGSLDGARIVSIYLEKTKLLQYFMTSQYDKVLESVQKVQLLVRPARFVLIDHWCYQMQAAAFLALRKQKLSAHAEQEAEKIRQRFPFPILPPFELPITGEDVSVGQVINH